LRIAVLTQLGEWSSSTRARALQYVPLLEEIGEVDVFLPDDRPPRRPGPLGRVVYFAEHGRRYATRFRQVSLLTPDYDALFVQRGLYPLGPGYIVRTIERFNGRVVYDIDDALYTETPAARQRGPVGRWIYGPQQALRLIDRADTIVVSTEALAAGLPTQKRNIVVLPTIPNVASYRQATDGGTPGLIGWAGTNGGLHYLDPLADVFERLHGENIGRLRVISSIPWWGCSEFQEWKLKDESQMFAPLAVGIMPLPDTEYAEAKAGYKLLQYMAAGVPVVASPVGVNRKLVEQSGAGYLAKSPDEWDQALRTLLRDPDLRKAMGESGRAYVAQHADLAGQARVLASLFRRETQIDID
jgi:hypothetical protein